jgi:hypothetical protein
MIRTVIIYEKDQAHNGWLFGKDGRRREPRYSWTYRGILVEGRIQNYIINFHPLNHSFQSEQLFCQAE